MPLIEKDGSVGYEISIACEEALGWATIDGAKMARLDKYVGSITPGKKADLVLLDRRLNMTPFTNAATAIVLHANPGNVESVMVDGKFLKREFKLGYDGLPELLGSVEKARDRIFSDFATLNPI